MKNSAVASIPAHIPKELVFSFDIYHDPRVTDNVHETYASLHRDAPDVFYSPLNGGHWVATRLDVISEIVRDPENFSAAEMHIPRVPNPPVMIPLNLDPPASLPYRQALMPFFAPKTVNEMEEKIRVWAQQIVAEVADKGQCDFVHDVASLFPVSIFMELMGMPLDKLREFRKLADDFFDAETADELHAASAAIVGNLTEQIERQRQNPGKGLISHLINVDIGGRKMTLDEIQNMCFVLFLGGMDTVTNVTSFMFRQLAQQPELQQRLAEHPEQIPKLIEEGLRCFGVVNTPRMVARDNNRFGVPFRAGDMVLCLLPLCGRDDRKNPDPNRFDIDRQTPAHLTFSTGPHLCIGHFLGRMEMRVLTEEWLKRIPAFRLKPGGKHGFRLSTVMAIESLPLLWDVKPN